MKDTNNGDPIDTAELDRLNQYQREIPVDLRQLIDKLEAVNAHPVLRRRELSLAITSLEVGELWLGRSG